MLSLETSGQKLSIRLLQIFSIVPNFSQASRFQWDAKPLCEVKPCFFTQAWTILAWKPGLLIDCFKMIDNF